MHLDTTFSGSDCPGLHRHVRWHFEISNWQYWKISFFQYSQLIVQLLSILVGKKLKFRNMFFSLNIVNTTKIKITFPPNVLTFLLIVTKKGLTKIFFNKIFCWGEIDNIMNHWALLNQINVYIFLAKLCSS